MKRINKEMQRDILQVINFHTNQMKKLKDHKYQTINLKRAQI
jgi:hypothetical protein